MSGKSTSKIGEDWEFIGTLILWLLARGFNEFMAFVTRFYPFSLFFTDRSFHARWYGAEKMLNVISLASFCYNNHFVEDRGDRDQYYYQI
jgi:hypothetical protein